MMNDEKIFKVRGKEEKYSDEELVAMIKSGELKATDLLTSADLKNWITIGESIYQFYLEGDKKDEIIQ